MAAMKHIDIKSLLIGFFFGTTLLLVVGQRTTERRANSGEGGGMASKIQAVSIVGPVVVTNEIRGVYEGDGRRRKWVRNEVFPFETITRNDLADFIKGK